MYTVIHTLYDCVISLPSDIEPPTQPVTPTVGSLVQQQSIPTQYIIIGGAAGGIVLLILIIVIIIIITAVHVRRRGNMRS